jgi:hypothetical protein
MLERPQIPQAFLVFMVTGSLQTLVSHLIIESLIIFERICQVVKDLEKKLAGGRSLP